ncbi:hypothetical protein WFC_00020 [Escherichia phage vB_EcoM_WFC]|uniref:Uncharacterized protein n=4 Tax=root TaxID=1 RepID=A0A386KKN2_9CAUD|nr:hypothetical protein HOU28_gp80 [Escherichia phage FEC19]YP_009823573.1 hypothetical protein HOV52_gp020 [Escherichia phage vB_EcoM_WFC]EFD7392045.1 hypothetical protein [Escherichia coli]UYE90896.1 hypothetical protein SP13_021 [Escherichia phage vB_EcoM_SP13]WAQ79425.1 hypothetical protein F13_0039 [Escherichia phage F13]AYD85509.1 hypothetical protein [Escherichia phage FEC19]QBQ77412.1 hypothetical protein WFC_00020 [Escherichia phage vB_EcoM_WFC]
MRTLTELDVLKDVAAALGVELSEKATLGALRRDLLEAVDRNDFDRKCMQKKIRQAVRAGKRFRARSFAARKLDLQHGML